MSWSRRAALQCCYPFGKEILASLILSANERLTSWPYSQGEDTPHSHIENRIGRPVAFNASLIASYRFLTDICMPSNMHISAAIGYSSTFSYPLSPSINKTALPYLHSSTSMRTCPKGVRDTTSRLHGLQRMTVLPSQHVLLVFGCVPVMHAKSASPFSVHF